jgi:hypothetical protein
VNQRVAAAVGGLVVAGAVMGAVAGAIVALVFDLFLAGVPSLIDSLLVARFGAALGALLGAVLLPLTSFTVLRHAALWRVVAEPTVGAVVGGAVGAALMLIPVLGRFDLFLGTVALGTLGFAGAAARLALRSRRQAALPPA